MQYTKKKSIPQRIATLKALQTTRLNFCIPAARILLNHTMAWRAAAVDFDSSSAAAKQAVGKVIATLEVASQNVVKDVVGGRRWRWETPTYSTAVLLLLM